MLATQIGYYSLIFGLIAGLLIILLSIKNYNNREIFINPKILPISFLQFFFVSISFIGLILSFINSDFSNETVYNNSHTTKPLFYKISGTWGNHEGSLLLWLLVLTLFIFLFLVTSSNQPKRYRILTLVFQQIIIIGFFLFVLITSNPFSNLFPVPQEGLGLNPILQDPALAIHPPILYIGYVGSSIIFASSLAAVVENYISKNWARHIKKWILISWVFLTIGIMLGSIWAYYELGWGGFWFWDPVENVSLMPWLCLTALLHCIIVLEKNLSLASWVVILSIASFTLSMSGTFLVRSGILNSVHTFANDPERGMFILIFLFILIFIALFIFFTFFKDNNLKKIKINWISKEASILVNNWFLMYFLAVILIGTVYPIFLEVITDEKISIGPPFFNKLIIPFLIFFLIFMAIVPSLNWIKSYLRIRITNIIFLILSIFLSYIVLDRTSSETLILTILLCASLYLFFITIREFFNKRFKNISQIVSHFGFSLLILSILLNSIFSKEMITNLKVGEKFNLKENIITFEKIENNKSKNYDSVIGYFKIQDKNQEIIYLKPEIRIYNEPTTITSEADIKTTLYTDKFLVMNFVKGKEYFNVRYQLKPYMIWIWISTIFIALGGFISFFKKEYAK